jgi:hypothetical protein
MVGPYHTGSIRMKRLAASALGVAIPLLLGMGWQDAGLDRVRWLAGCWEQRQGDRVTIEMWMAPAGGMMLGGSRSVAGGVTHSYEQLRLEARAGRLAYVALPSGQREATFTSTAVTDSGFTVENPAHDFPQRIIYRRRGVDSLAARVEGPGSGGTTRGFDVLMRRVPCEVR